MAVRLFCLLEEAYGRLVVMGGWCLWEAGGYGRLSYSSYGSYKSYMSHKTYNPHKPHKAFRLFKPLKTETAIRDLGWLFALVCYEKFERTLKLHSFGCCFTKHDLYRESIEIIFFRCLGFTAFRLFFLAWQVFFLPWPLPVRLCFCSQRSLFNDRCGVVYRRCGVHGALLQRVYGCRIGVSH